jgi:hypothetical protein
VAAAELAELLSPPLTEDALAKAPGHRGVVPVGEVLLAAQDRGRLAAGFVVVAAHDHRAGAVGQVVRSAKDARDRGGSLVVQAGHDAAVGGVAVKSADHEVVGAVPVVTAVGLVVADDDVALAVHVAIGLPRAADHLEVHPGQHQVVADDRDLREQGLEGGDPGLEGLALAFAHQAHVLPHGSLEHGQGVGRAEHIVPGDVPAGLGEGRGGRQQADQGQGHEGRRALVLLHRVLDPHDFRPGLVRGKARRVAIIGTGSPGCPYEDWNFPESGGEDNRATVEAKPEPMRCPSTPWSVDGRSQTASKGDREGALARPVGAC